MCVCVICLCIYFSRKYTSTCLHQHVYSALSKMFDRLTISTGQYRSGNCGPTGAEDYVCTACSKSCVQGEYIEESCADGKSLMDILCTPCATCMPGKYMSTACRGNETSDPVQCRECKTCDPGYRMGTSCDGSSLSDVVQCVQVRMSEISLYVCMCICMYTYVLSNGIRVDKSRSVCT